METKMETKLNPKRFDTSLVFFKDNNKYPQKGSIVRWDHGDYCDHIEDIEKNRTDPDVLKNGETFCMITQSYQKMLYNNFYNKTYPHLRNDIPLIVEEIFFQGKEVMARCVANGYIFPKDSVEEMKIILPADELSVVDVVLCEYIGVFCDSEPNDNNYMGFLDKNTSDEMGSKVYQKFKVRENYKYADILREMVIKNGIKEFSFLYPINPVTKKAVLLSDISNESSIKDTLENTEYQNTIPDEIEGSVESLSMDHPLSIYTKRMFASVVDNLDRELFSKNDMNNIYFDMLSVMKNSLIDGNGNIILTELDVDISDSVDRDY